MTEVWEEKDKIDSVNTNDQAANKPRIENNTPIEKNEIKNRTCQLCGRVFKNERARKTHEHHCKRRKELEQIEKVEPSEKGIAMDDLDILKEELLADMETIKEERQKLKEERTAFKAEIAAQLEKIRGEKINEIVHDFTDSSSRASTQPHPKTNSELEGEEEIIDEQQAGMVVLEEDEEIEDEYSLEDMEEDLEVIEPEIARIGEGISATELDQLSVELESIESELNTKVDFAALSKMSKDYQKSISALEDSISIIDHKVDEVILEIEESGRKYGSFHNVVREMEKLDERTTEILEEIGFGESLNVTKIPPNILESVYESTIEGVVNEIRRNYGSHDAESIIQGTIEDVRTRTSGSELFYFDGRGLKTRKLAQAISAKLISAKQVQTTYDELLSKLQDYVPGFKARNFRAMIKLKSQEYSVDKTTLLLESLDSLREDIDNLRNMLGTISNRQNSIENEINSVLGSKVGKEEIEQLAHNIEEIQAKQKNFVEMIKGNNETHNTEKEGFTKALETITKRINDLGATLIEKKAPLKQPKKEKKDKTEEPEKKEEETVKEEDKKQLTEKFESELNEDEKKIVSIIPEKGYTISRIKNELLSEMTEEKTEELVQSMINKGIMSTIKRGRHTIYIINERK